MSSLIKVFAWSNQLRSLSATSPSFLFYGGSYFVSETSPPLAVNKLLPPGFNRFVELYNLWIITVKGKKESFFWKTCRENICFEFVWSQRGVKPLFPGTCIQLCCHLVRSGSLLLHFPIRTWSPNVIAFPILVSVLCLWLLAILLFFPKCW